MGASARLETTPGAAVCNALGYNMEGATIVGAHVNEFGQNDNQWIFAVRDAASLRDIAAWPGMSTDRACRLLNGLYLTSALMVMRSHPAARQQHDLLSRLLRRDKPRR